MRVFRELASRPDQAFLRGSSVSRSDQLRTGEDKSIYVGRSVVPKLSE